MFSPRQFNTRPTVQTGLTHFRVASYDEETAAPIGDDPDAAPGTAPVGDEDEPAGVAP